MSKLKKPRTTLTTLDNRLTLLGSQLLGAVRDELRQEVKGTLDEQTFDRIRLGVSREVAALLDARFRGIESRLAAIESFAESWKPDGIAIVPSRRRWWPFKRSQP